MIDLTPIIEGIIALVGIVLTVVLAPYIKSKLSQSQLDKLNAVLKLAVMGAEEAERAGLLMIESKYEYAVNFLETYGYTFDAEKTRQLIDAAVWEYINKDKKAGV